jgi:hypothetical protein
MAVGQLPPHQLLNLCSSTSAQTGYLQELCFTSFLRSSGYQLQNLEGDFLFNPNLSGKASLTSGEIIAGSAGQVTIKGDGNKFTQGTSETSSTA